MPKNNALYYLDKDFGFGGNALDESAEMKVKKKNVHFWFISKKERQNSKNNNLLVSLLIIPLNGCSPLTWNTPATV